MDDLVAWFELFPRLPALVTEQTNLICASKTGRNCILGGPVENWTLEKKLLAEAAFLDIETLV